MICLKTVYLMCGIPGSGKSHVAKRIISNNSQGQQALARQVWISRDNIRFNLLGPNAKPEDYFSREDEVWTQFIHAIDCALADDNVNVIVIDATHITKRSREKLLRAISIDRRFEIYLFVQNFTCPIDLALTRNNNRNGLARVPDSVIKNMAEKYEEPTKEEFNYTSSLGVKTIYIYNRPQSDLFS